MKIKKYRLEYTEEDKEFVKKLVNGSLDRGYLTDGGPNVAEFERLWCEFNNSKHSIAVSNCTAGLECILKALNLAGCSVIVPAYTFIASPMSIFNAGAIPIYADVDSRTLGLSLDSIKRVVRDDTKAVMIVHVGGVVTNEIEKIQKWCLDNEIFLIEDAACAHGSEFNNVKSGNFGVASCFSFHHSKVLTSGEGGVITTSSDELAEKMRRIRAIGLDRSINNYESFEVGSNYKMSEITAALAILHTKKAYDIIEERKNIAKEYDKKIKFNKVLKSFKVPEKTSSCYYKYYMYANSSETRDRFVKFCQDRDIDLPPFTYQVLCSQQLISKKIGAVCPYDLSSSEWLTNHITCLPMYNGLTQEEIKFITDTVNCFLENEERNEN